MGTTIRPEVSWKSRWYISRHRYYELKHFCLQYKEWKGAQRRYRSLVTDVCLKADPSIGAYIFRAVTEDRSYTYLKTTLGMPCGRSMYFDRYRKFFWLLSDALWNQEKRSSQ